MDDPRTEIINKAETTSSSGSEKEIVKGGVSAFIMRLLGIAVNWVFTVIIARGFGAAGTGIYSLSLLVLNFFGTISKLGSDTLMTRFTAQYVPRNDWSGIKDLFNKSMYVSVPLSIACSLAMYFSAPWLASSWFEKPNMALYFQVAAFMLLPLTVFQITNGGLRGLKRVREYTFLINMSPYLFGTVALVAFMLVSHNNVVVLYAYGIGIAGTCLLSLYWWIRYSKYAFTKVFESIEFNEKFWIGMSLFVGALFSLVRGWTDTAILGKYGTEADVGIYKTAFKIAIITRITLTAILVPAAPKFAELFSQGKMKELARASQFATKIIFWTSAPILLVIMLFPELILSIFGSDFKAGWPALMILSAGQFINSATGPVGNILNMTGKQNVNRNVTVFATLVGVGLDLLLIPKYGATGAAFVNTFGVCIMNVLPFFLVRYYFGFFTLNLRDLFTINPRTFVSEIRQSLKREKKKKGDNDEAAADDPVINNFD